MVRLKDIAEVCGVSVATVSRALNGLTSESKERTAFICQTARDMGYYPNAAAKTLKTSRSSNIGILYEEPLLRVIPALQFGFNNIFFSAERNHYRG